MYCSENFKTKKELKAAVKVGRMLTVFDPGPGLAPVVVNGTVCISGPWFPQPHTWYAEVKLHGGVIVSVK